MEEQPRINYARELQEIGPTAMESHRYEKDCDVPGCVSWERMDLESEWIICYYKRWNTQDLQCFMSRFPFSSHASVNKALTGMAANRKLQRIASLGRNVKPSISWTIGPRDKTHIAVGGITRPALLSFESMDLRPVLHVMLTLLVRNRASFSAWDRRMMDKKRHLLTDYKLSQESKSHGDCSPRAA